MVVNDGSLKYLNECAEGCVIPYYFPSLVCWSEEELALLLAVSQHSLNQGCYCGISAGVRNLCPSQNVPMSLELIMQNLFRAGITTVYALFHFNLEQRHQAVPSASIASYFQLSTSLGLFLGSSAQLLWCSWFPSSYGTVILDLLQIRFSDWDDEAEQPS